MIDEEVELLQAEIPEAFRIPGAWRLYEQVLAGRGDNGELLWTQADEARYLVAPHPINGGATGAIYEAWDVRMGMEVVAKTVRIDRVLPDEREEMFGKLKQEAWTMARFKTGVVTVYEVIRAQMPWWNKLKGERELVPVVAIVMERMDPVKSPTLKDKMAGKISKEETVRWTAQLGATLDRAAKPEINIRHGDVKPGNIFIRDGQAVLGDWGIASPVPKVADEAVGTPHYMSPEVVRNDKDKITPKSDLFSLAIVAYEMIQGELPFSDIGDLPLEIMGKIAKGEWKRTGDEVLDKVFEKAFSEEPEKRYQIGEELARALGEALKVRVQ